MQTAEKDGLVFPLVIHGKNDQFCLAAITNQKGFNKSLENGLLWVIEGNTGRLLPLTELNAEFQSNLVSNGRSEKARYLARLEMRPGYAQAWLDLDFAAPKAPERAKAQANPVKTLQTYTKSEQSDLAGFLFTLQDLIRQRRADMPEGSYTTHLFKSGPGKIRKKTGEEAVELILAQDGPEIASEASDLLYHMLVLLVDAEVDLELVLQELRKR